MLIPLQNIISKYNIHPKGILHLGANEGQEANMYYDCGVEKTIWIEAIPRVYEKLHQNVLRFPNATAVQACLSDRTGDEVVFHIANNEGQSSSVLEFGTHSSHHPTVRFVENITLITSRVDDLGLDLSGIDMICMDCQGFEGPILKGVGDLSQYNVIYSEVNNDEVYQGCTKIWELDEYLKERGFERVETLWTSASWGDAAYIRRELII